MLSINFKDNRDSVARGCGIHIAYIHLYSLTSDARYAQETLQHNIVEIVVM